MQEIKKCGAQGDCLFRRVDKVPAGFVAEDPKVRTVLAHSETGHDHSIDVAGVRLFVGKDPLVAYLMLETVERADVTHHRSFDTHETVGLTGGPGAVWEIRRQREYTPEGWRRVED